MLFDEKKQVLPRITVGAGVGVTLYLFLSWLTQPGSLLGGRMGLEFTFCFNGYVPEALGAALGFLTWGAFGAEAALATVPFADTGRQVALRSAAHFAAMALTLSAWALLNFSVRELAYFLVPFTLLYILIWLGRWVGWYAEVAQFRERLGLAPGPSFLKWKETLPHIAFAGLLCLVTPLVLRLCDAPDVPVLSLMYAGLLLPIGGLISGASLGRRQGFCPLYPVACGGFYLLFIPLARFCSNVADADFLPVALLAPLMGNVLGAAIRRGKNRRED